ncbi:MAG: flagellar basal-body MS-ring/collar protein FliF [Anaerolineae bacterium]
MSQALVPSNQAELTQIWREMSLNRKIGLAALVVAAITGLIFFLAWSQAPDYAVAFSGLNAEDASAITTHLQENNINYELSEGGSTISVPADQVHQIRLDLASQGLPGQGNVGMELFDSTNLGMTDFVQQVNYQRALEGELARTISSLNNVHSARVHIVIPQPTLYSDEEQPTTASVVIELENGQNINKEQVQAISHLVSSAVEGLSPENLTIVDMNGHVLADGANATDNSAVAVSSTQLEAQRSYERDLELRIETMLRNVLGPNKAVVRVNSEMNWDQIETESETYTPAPEGSVLRSSRVITEYYAGASDTTGGVPGTASNIPDAAPSFQTAISGTNNGGYLRSDTTQNFEVSRSTSKIKPATGQVERLSVSVMVDNITNTVTMDAIQQATIAAAGLDTARGDTITVNSVPFDRTYEQEQAAAMEAMQQRELYLQIAQWAIVAIVLIALFFVVRSLQRSLRPQPNISVEAQGAAALTGSQDPREALLNEVTRAGEDGDMLRIGPPQFSEEQKAAAEKAQMLRQLQLMSKNRSETLANIIQFWLSEDSGGKT